MYPDLYLYTERVRARELRAAAEHDRLGRRAGSDSMVRVLERRLGWALVETGLRLVHRRAVDY